MSANLVISRVEPRAMAKSLLKRPMALSRRDSRHGARRGRNFTQVAQLQREVVID
jgi:hypothetical protein